VFAGCAQAIPGLAIIGVNACHRLELRRGFRLLADESEDEAQAIMCVRVVWFLTEDTVKNANRAFKIRVPVAVLGISNQESDAEVDLAGHPVRSQLADFFESFDGFLLFE